MMNVINENELGQFTKRHDINLDDILFLRKLSKSWNDISKELNCSRWTLTRWRNYDEEYERTISDDDLDEIISEYKANNFNRGEIMTLAYIKGNLNLLSVTRQQVRDSLQRIDADGIEHRKRKRVKRVVYNVHGPHYLWHIDGHHKLIKWKIVTHGCVDGFTRLIIYLCACNNNLSSTTLPIFIDATRRYTVPYKVRADGGGENIKTQLFMETVRSNVDKPFIIGSSVHNVRIERLWRDVFTHVICFYYNMFTSLEQEDLLDANNSFELYILHYMFIPRINESLNNFISTWNNHKLSTEKNKTPICLEYDNRDHH